MWCEFGGLGLVVWVWWCGVECCGVVSVLWRCGSNNIATLETMLQHYTNALIR